MNVAEAIMPGVRTALLELFLTNPHRRYYFRELVTRLGVGNSSVQNDVERLVDCGLLVRERTGRRLYLRADVSNPVYPHLRALLEITVGLVGRLREALAPIESMITVAFIFGSMADDTSTDASDVDLCVVGDVDFDEVVAVLGPVERRIGREINPSVMPVDEYVRRYHGGSAFLERIVNGPKRFVVGCDRDLADLAG